MGKLKGSVYETARGWTCQWTVGNGSDGKPIRDSRTFKTKEEAEAHRAYINATGTGTGAMSLEARWNQWTDERLALGKISEKTAVGYFEKAAAWGALLGTGPYKNLRTGDIDRAFSRMAQGHTPSGRIPSPRTLAHYRTALATFFNAMVKKDEVIRSPVAGVETVKTRTKTRRAPTPQEFAVMLECADKSNGAFGQCGTILRFAIQVGLRRGELCALCWADIDLDARRLQVCRSASQPKGGRVFFKEPKSEAGRRRIALPAPAVKLLMDQRARVSQWRLALGSDWADNDLVFCKPTGEVLNIEQLSRVLGEIRDEAGVSCEVQPLHGMRNFHLTAMHTAGVDLATVQARAGHADVRSTLGYITVSEDADEAAADAAVSALEGLL